MSFRKQAVSGFKWSFVDAFLKYFFTFFVSIVLARLLNPSDFGLVAMVTIFTSISNTLIDGGFGDSLIRKTNSNEIDYNTVFTFNFLLSLILFILLFSSADIIANFYKEKEVAIIIRISSISLMVGSFSLVQIALLRKQVDFRKQAKITLINRVVSGIASIIMAYTGFGYMSILIPSLIANLLAAFFLNLFSEWKPRFNFSFSVFKSHFKFGYKIMLSSFIYMINQNIYFVFLGKFYSAIDLGFFYRADNIQKLPSSNIDNIIRHVTYSLFSKIQNESETLIDKYRQILRYTSTLNSFILLGFAANAKLIVIVLFGNKWLPSVEYLQLLCFTGVLFPLISVNINILNVKGRSDITLKFTMLRLLFSLIVIFLGYYYGIKFMIASLVFAYAFEYFIVALVISNIVCYSIFEQMKDISKGLLLSILFFSIIMLISKLLVFDNIILNILGILVSNIIVFISINKVFHNKEYLLLEKLIINKVVNFKNKS